jgi:integrase
VGAAIGKPDIAMKFYGLSRSVTRRQAARYARSPSVLACVPRLTVHQLRYQCASPLFASDADLKQVQHYLGHSRASVTLDIYTHLLTGSDDEMARRLEQALD